MRVCSYGGNGEVGEDMINFAVPRASLPQPYLVDITICVLPGVGRRLGETKTPAQGHSSERRS